MTGPTPTSVFPNRYAGTCRTCRARVAPQAGTTAKIGGGYVVWCSQHSPQVAAPSGVARISLHGAGARLDLDGKLDGNTFTAYRAAQVQAGARWDRALGTVTLRIDQIAPLVAALAAAGVPVQAAPEISGALDAQRATSEAEVSAARARAEAVDAVLAARGNRLYPYQRHGIGWLAPRAGALLADDMGLGKTIQALIAAPAGAPILVVCPAVAKGVWSREAARWRPDLTVAILAGRGSFRWPTPGEIVVVNYDILPASLDSEAPAALVVLADEAHALKSSDALRTKRFGAIAQAARQQGGRTWLLTATPVLGKPPELYSLLRAAGVEREGIGGWDGLVAAFDGKKDRFGWTWARRTLCDEDVARLQGVMLRRVKGEVLTDLPEKRVEVLRVEINEKTIRACNAAERAAGQRPGGLDKVIEQIASGGLAFEEIAAARAALAVGKIPALVEILDQIEEEEAGPVVVFSAHTAAVHMLAKREGWAIITGETPPAERTQIEEAFQAGQLRGVAASIKAGGVAITLTRANRSIFLDLEWSESLNQQAEDRIYRLGQTRGCLITRLVADHPLDERVNEILSRKAALVDGSVNASRRGADEAVSSVPDYDEALAALEAQHALHAERFAAAAAADAEWQALVAQIEDEEAAKSDDERAAERAAERFAAAVERAVERREVSLGERREARTPREVWALAALAQLASDDLDHAKEQNGAGFSKSDTYRGHALLWLAEDLGLDNEGWEEAAALAAYYRRQVGSPPRD